MVLKALLGVLAVEFAIFIYLFIQAFPFWEQIPALTEELKANREALEKKKGGG